jgi:hypothetical protein
MVRCIPKILHLTAHVQEALPRVVLTPAREGIAYIGIRFFLKKNLDGNDIKCTANLTSNGARPGCPSRFIIEVPVAIR